jgi:multidrug efflux system membrane fusion protein
MAFRRLTTVMVLGALMVGCSKKPPSKVETGPLLVTVGKPYVDKVTEFTDLTGETDAVKTVQVRPRVSGYIQKVNFEEGAEVKAGAVLFVIDPAPYEADLRKAKGDVQNWDAQIKLAKAEESRYAKLAAKGSGSKEDFEKAIASVGVAEANLYSAKAAVDRAELDLKWTNVTTDIAGKVDRAYLTEGNVATGGLSQGTVLTTVVSIDPMYAYFDVDDQTVLYYQQKVREGKLKSSRDGDVLIEMALRGEQGYPHKGRIDFVSNRINPSTGSLQIRGVFDNKDRSLYPGLFARARVPISQPYDAVMVPEASVITDQDKKLVYVVNADNMVEAREVKLGPMTKGLRVVVEGLKAEDRVVIKGMQRVRPKVKVEVEEGKITPGKELADVGVAAPDVPKGKAPAKADPGRAGEQ